MTGKIYDVGYKKPSEAAKWKKGQCGNTERRYAPRLKTTAQLVDREFNRLITFTENGCRRSATVYEIICIQLATKVAVGGRGSKKAQRVYEKYKAFAKSQGGGAPTFEFRVYDGQYMPSQREN